MNKTIFPALLVSAFSFSAMAAEPAAVKTSPQKTVTKAVKDVAIKTSDFSATTKPTKDFYDYVNEKWIKSNPIPNDKAGFGMFEKLDEESRIVIKRILENAANLKIKAPKGSNLQILGDFYRSAMDTAAIDKAGVQPLQGWLEDIQNATTPQAFAKDMAKLQLRNINTPIGYYVEVDAKNSTRYVMYISQGGLGLPDRDFYFRTDEKSKKNLEAYKGYIKSIMTLAKLDKTVPADQLAEQVLEVEMAIAKASLSKLELRDPEKNYNLYTIDRLKSEFKNFDWDAFFGEMNAAPKEIIVGQPTFMHALDSLLVALPLDKWVSYQQFHLINSNAKYLNSEIVQARFDFFGKTLGGVKTMEPRWKRVSRISEDLLRDLIGQEYVKTKFSPLAKKRAIDLVENIRASLAERINNLEWMGAETKAKALEKLQKIDVKIGYPDKWWTYEKTDVSNQPYVLNVLNCSYAENLRVLERMKKDKIDRTEWLMGPQTVNAYYNPLINEIVFPAAILQPPFFYANGDDAVNYGGIGMVIGHEITHGFDDEGCQYDAEGNLKNWWTPEDKKRYEALTDKFVAQYSKYSPFPEDNIYVNGALTLGENIADLGGMMIGFNALKKALSEMRLN
ncbi:MAG: M13 family metallopeptidase [Chitinophagales bacterium]